jgi:hypothetical protein
VSPTQIWLEGVAVTLTPETPEATVTASVLVAVVVQAFDTETEFLILNKSLNFAGKLLNSKIIVKRSPSMTREIKAVDLGSAIY